MASSGAVGSSLMTRWTILRSVTSLDWNRRVVAKKASRASVVVICSPWCCFVRLEGSVVMFVFKKQNKIITIQIDNYWFQ